MMKMVLITACLFLFPEVVFAKALHGSDFSAWWSVPFIGVLLSIALLPLWVPRFWHAHFGKVVLGWTVLFLICFSSIWGLNATWFVLMHVLFEEYLPFILLLTALFVVAGGICVRAHLPTSAKVNTGLIALGALLASFMGTTGASMLLIRPLLRANRHRKHVVHVVVFFIFLVANVGGALTPLGDPPLFLGFLNGVGFFWTAKHLFFPMITITSILLLLFYLLDRHYLKKDQKVLKMHRAKAAAAPKLSRIIGKWNFLLLGLIIVLVLTSGFWKTDVEVAIFGTYLSLESLIRDFGLLIVTLLSLKMTPQLARQENNFDWAPMKEVAKIFIGIFITITPVILILKAGTDGAFSQVIHWVRDAHGHPDNVMYFWVTGILSSFLDNAPTYLVFFNVAGGNAHWLMTEGANTLAAISAGAVFMGANTYIGNAPNFMVKAIAEAQGVKMPSFLGYMLWSIGILLPTFFLCTWLFF